MKNMDRIQGIKYLIQPELHHEDEVIDILECIGALKHNYYDYMVTNPINCDEELKRLPNADYDTTCALITMLLREDHFSNGAFRRRYEKGEVVPIFERMIELLSDAVDTKVKSVKIISRLGYGAPDESIEQHVTISSTGRIY